MNIRKGVPLQLLLALVLLQCSCPNPGPENNFYRDQMRAFVQNLAAYARGVRPSFIIIPQNGHELLTLNGMADGALATDYAKALSGIGREDLFYGYAEDNTPTSPDLRDAMLGFLDLAEQQGIEVLVIDYCWTPSYVDDSYLRSSQHGFISFAAHHRELDDLPPYPSAPYRAHPGDCATLSQARNFLYLINPDSLSSRAALLTTLQRSDYDALVIDLFYAETALTAAEVQALKTKAHGGRRMVIAYLSIGEAEDYRYYWNPSWKSNPPFWLDKENPEWQGNYKVKYWEKGWQDIIFGNDLSYVKRVLDAGFDGAYLDLIDAYEYWEDR